MSGPNTSNEEVPHSSTTRFTTLSVVATLIATVTFTAGFTLPGGLIQEGEHKGSPILKYNAAFIAFVITDSLSFVLSISVVLHLFFATYRKSDTRAYDSMLYKCGILTMLAMTFMSVAFGTGLYAVLGVSKGFGVVTLSIALSFFFVYLIVSFSMVHAAERPNSRSTSCWGKPH